MVQDWRALRHALHADYEASLLSVTCGVLWLPKPETQVEDMSLSLSSHRLRLRVLLVAHSVQLLSVSCGSLLGFWEQDSCQNLPSSEVGVLMRCSDA